MTAHHATTMFFDEYARALLDRDAEAIADQYAVPALIAFPDQLIAVTDRSQTVEFFASAVAQYDGVTTTQPEVHAIAETGHSVWADVTWLHDGQPAERFMYQLVHTAGRLRIAVLTPLDR